MAVSLKERSIQGYMEPNTMLGGRTREQAEALYAHVQATVSRRHGFAWGKLFGWSFYGGMHKSRSF